MSIIPGFSPNLLGNLKRIEEYQALGQTEDSILERFEKNGVPISRHMVRAVEAGDIQLMSAKAVPKKDVKELKKELARLDDTLATSNLSSF